MCWYLFYMCFLAAWLLTWKTAFPLMAHSYRATSSLYRPQSYTKHSSSIIGMCWAIHPMSKAKLWSFDRTVLRLNVVLSLTMMSLPSIPTDFATFTANSNESSCTATHIWYIKSSMRVVGHSGSKKVISSMKFGVICCRNWCQRRDLWKSTRVD